MKFIKFNMRDKRLNLTLPMSKAEQILNSDLQTVMVTNPDGSWSGIYINTADISSTERDMDAEREWRMKNPTPQIEEPKGTPVNDEYMEKINQQVKEILKNKRV